MPARVDPWSLSGLVDLDRTKLELKPVPKDEPVAATDTGQLADPRPFTEGATRCVRCGDGSKLLCQPCASTLTRPRALCSEQIWSWSLDTALKRASDVSPTGRARQFDPRESHVLLIDLFGRPHRLSSAGNRRNTSYRVGRDRRCSISIAEVSVSRSHAIIEYREFSGAWFVTDHNSRNGTRVGARKLSDETAEAPSGHQICFGSVGFYVIELEDSELAWAEAQLLAVARSHIQRVPRDLTQPRTLTALRDSATGGGLIHKLESNGEAGIAISHSHRRGTVEITLTQLEFELLQVLDKRRRDEADLSPGLRGFMSTTELLSLGLPFETKNPNNDNLKRLIRRIREKFLAKDVTDVIQGLQGRGYRIPPVD